MSVPAITLRQHLDYHAWASARLTAAAVQLPERDLNRDFQTSERTVLGTLVHVYAGDRVWLNRVLGRPPQPFLDPAVDLNLHVIQNDWPVLLNEWVTWSETLDDLGAELKIAYHDLKGNPYQTPIWQIVLHVVNHGTHHRGQVSGMLRAMGQAPPSVDLIAYYRLKAMATP